MKQKLQMLGAALMLCATPLFAHDFEVGGIYYNITSAEDKTVEVTYSSNSYSAVENEYSGSVTIPETVTYNDNTYSVTSIRYSAFKGCSNLTSVVIPNSVTYIGGGTFDGCSSLTSIVVAEGNSRYDSRDNCNAIIETQTNTLIIGCSKTTIPNSVTSIGGSAFEYCSSLTSVVIPNSVTSIGDYAFYDCSGLTSVVIGNSVTSIGDNAFYWCIRLTSVEIPNSVTSIGDGAFHGCSSLTSVVIGNSVTNIGNLAFYNCSSLTSITSYIPADKLFEIESDVFQGIDKTNCTLYVPYGAQDMYAATTGWSDFTNIVEMPASITVSNAGYATLYLDYAAKIPEGVEVYTASEIEGDRLMMDLVEDVLPANTGVLVKAPAGTYTFNYNETEVPAIADNLFSGSVTAEYIDVPSNKTAFVLSAVNDNVGMYLAKLTDGQFLNNANKAYLLLSKDKLGISDEEVDTSIGGMQLSLRFDFNGSTGIDGVQTETSVQGAIYDLYGRKLQSVPTKGLYIINGKKVLVK